MFGKNPIAPIETSRDGSSLRLVKGSPFATVQGEGPYTGRRATFIRLHGCNLRCTFCDTEFSHPDDPWWSLDELLTEVHSKLPRLAVITGGEPLRQNILPLCKSLKEGGFIVQIETAGTIYIPEIEQYAEIVCSPKTPTIHKKILEHAVAFKYVMDSGQRFEGYVPITATQPGAKPARLASPREGAPVYLSPMDTGDETLNAMNRQLVGKIAQKYENTIAGIQLHKFMDLD